jgi:hypothetical protein
MKNSILGGQWATELIGKWRLAEQNQVSHLGRYWGFMVR